MRRIFLDYASTTPIDARVTRAMRPYAREIFGNPSSIHAEGRAARAAVEAARGTVAALLGARAKEITFTNGVTEAVNIAVLGVLRAAPSTHHHIVTVATEHRAVLGALAETGAEVSWVPVGRHGEIAAKDVLAAVRPDTALVSLMYANNEIGTIAPIAEIGAALARQRRTSGSVYPLLHTDAAQAAQFLPMQVEALHVDLMSLSGQKMYGPKGTGALYAKTGVPIAPIFFGGAQEHGLRPGTENVAGIMGFSAALDLALHSGASETERIRALRDRLAHALLQLPGTCVNSDLAAGLPNILNVSFDGVDGEALVMYLDAHGIAVSTASSCTGAHGTSHVLRALGIPERVVKGSVRFSLGRATTKRDIDTTVRVLASCLPLLSSSL